MAKYECRLIGDFEKIRDLCANKIISGSMSASYEDGSEYEIDGVRVSVKVFERYSAIGSNRVSLNLTIIGKEEKVFVTAITSGGSQATFFKINTIGEEAFLNTLVDALSKYK